MSHYMTYVLKGVLVFRVWQMGAHLGYRDDFGRFLGHDNYFALKNWFKFGYDNYFLWKNGSN